MNGKQLLLCICAILVNMAMAGEAGAPAPGAPANTWVKLIEGGTGPQCGVGLVWAPSLEKFVLFPGAWNDPPKGPMPYDVLSFRMGEDKWRNEFPAGKNWGPEYGPANPPGHGNIYARTVVDKEGNCRPSRQMIQYATFVCAVDPDANGMWAILDGHTMFYSFKDMTWQAFGDKQGPGAGTPRPLHYGALVYDPVNREMVQFGGAWGAAQLEGATTWLFSTKEKKWRKLELRSECLDEPRKEAEGLRSAAKDLVAALRNRLHKTELPDKSKVDLTAEAGGLAGKVEALSGKLAKAAPGNEQEKRQLGWASADLGEALSQLNKVKAGGGAVMAETVKTAHRAEWSLMRARDALEVQPPPRINAPMAYDPKNGKVVLFGGDRWGHLCAETWLYDVKTRTWAERRPAASPPARAGHALVHLPMSGKVLLVGGHEYGDGSYHVYGSIPRLDMWVYDVAANQWQLVKHFGAKDAPDLGGGWARCMPAVAAAGPGDQVVVSVWRGFDKPRDTWACRVDAATGDAAEAAKLGVKPGTVKRQVRCFDPEWFEEGTAQDEGAIAAKLAALPANKWVAMNPPKLLLSSRVWGTFAFDPDRDQILVFGGGHGEHGGTDVAHYSIKQNRWSIGFSPEGNLDYKAGGSSGGWPIAPFTGRPFTPHSYLCYCYHPETKKLYAAPGGYGPDQTPRIWAYDPDRREWEQPKPLPFDHRLFNTALRSSGHGLVAWAGLGAVGLWLCPDPAANKWEALVQPGKGGLTHHYTEESGMAWDSRRDRMLLFKFGQEKDKHKIRAYDFKSKTVSVLEPKDGDRFPASAGVARHALYLPEDDLALVPTPGKPGPLTLFYDCAANEWLRMAHAGAVPDEYFVSTGMMWDPARKLIWAGDGYMPNGQIWVMKFDRKTANLKPAGGE